MCLSRDESLELVKVLTAMLIENVEIRQARTVAELRGYHHQLSLLLV